MIILWPKDCTGMDGGIVPVLPAHWLWCVGVVPCLLILTLLPFAFIVHVDEVWLCLTTATVGASLSIQSLCKTTVCVEIVQMCDRKSVSIASSCTFPTNNKVAGYCSVHSAHK